MAYEYLCLHQHDIHEYVHNGLTAKRAHVTKWHTSNNVVKYIEVSIFISKMFPCTIGCD